MKKLLFSGVSGLMILASACGGGNEPKVDAVDSAKMVNKEVKAVQPDASNFAVTAANGGMMEVELGKVAQENASNPRVKAFGAMMVRDHSEANNKLKSIAGTLNIVLPDSVSNDTRKEINEMKMKKGKDFDKMYVKMMLDDHKTDVAAFQKCAADCSDSMIKSFAATTLPVLQTHLDSIQSIAGKNKRSKEIRNRKGSRSESIFTCCYAFALGALFLLSKPELCH